MGLRFDGPEQRSMLWLRITLGRHTARWCLVCNGKFRPFGLGVQVQNTKGPIMPATSAAVSEARQAANQANAKYSTGPRSPEGNARAAANSRTHALCSKDVVVASPEEQVEFNVASNR
jgi:hypothetical protein